MGGRHGKRRNGAPRDAHCNGDSDSDVFEDVVGTNVEDLSLEEYFETAITEWTDPEAKAAPVNCISDLGCRSDSSGPAKVEAAPEKFAKRSPPPIRQRYVSGATTFSEELEFWKTRTRHAEVRADVAEGKARNLQKQLKTKGGGTGTLELRKQRRRGGGVINPAEW